MNQPLTRYEIDMIVRHGELAKQAAAILHDKSLGYHSLASDLLLSAGYVAGLAVRGREWPQVEAPTVPETDRGLDGELS